MKKYSNQNVNKNYLSVFNMYKLSFGKRCNLICKNQIIKRNYLGFDYKLIFMLTKSLKTEKNLTKRDESFLDNSKFIKKGDKILESNSKEMSKLNKELLEIIKNKTKDFNYIKENIYKNGKEFHEKYNNANYKNLKKVDKEIVEKSYIQENYKHNQICETTEQGFKDIVEGNLDSEEKIYSAHVTTDWKDINVFNTNENIIYNITKEKGLQLEGSNPYDNENYKSYIMNGKNTTVGEFNEHGGLTKSLQSMNRFEKVVGTVNFEEIKKKGIKKFMEENGKDLEIEGMLRKTKNFD